jgi:hypothetical protein
MLRCVDLGRGADVSEESAAHIFILGVEEEREKRDSTIGTNRRGVWEELSHYRNVPTYLPKCEGLRTNRRSFRMSVPTEERKRNVVERIMVPLKRRYLPKIGQNGQAVSALTFPRSLDTYLPVYTASHSRRL